MRECFHHSERKGRAGNRQESSELGKIAIFNVKEVIWCLTSHCRSAGIYSEANQEPQEGSKQISDLI